jgi:hypothetical protein
MNDQDFRDHVIGSLATITERMESLPDLKKNIEDVGKDVDDLKLSRARDRGIAMGLSAAVSVTVTIFKSWMFGR